MKRIAILAMILALLTAMAFADGGPAYSARYMAVNAAQHALAEKYGVTEGMNEYFVRSVVEQEDGSYVIYWQPAISEGALPWLLGTYKALVRDGEVEILWTHDGKSTEGGYKAEAWGAPQLGMMADEVRSTFEMTESWSAAESSAYADAGPYHYETVDTGFDTSDEAAHRAMAGSVISRDDADAAARAALRETYGALEWERLELDENEELGVLYDRPVVVLRYDLWGQGREDWEWQEGDGHYEVTVDLTDGSIEEILYQNCLSGNG